MTTFFLIYAASQRAVVLFFGRIYYVRTRREFEETRRMAEQPVEQDRTNVVPLRGRK